MKRFSRCVLIWIIVTILGSVGAYLYVDNTTTTMYSSTATLIVTPGEENEASLRASNGGLNNDFKTVFLSSVVISAAQKTAGTSENIADYLTVDSPADSNIIKITCTNPDQETAKKYVDAVAKNAAKTKNIIPIKAIQVLEYGDISNVVVKPNLYQNFAMIAGCISAACLLLEIIIVLFLSAFRSADEDYDDDAEYVKKFGEQKVVSPKKVAKEEKKAKKKAIKEAAAGLEDDLDGIQMDDDEPLDEYLDDEDEDITSEEDEDGYDFDDEEDDVDDESFDETSEPDDVIDDTVLEDDLEDDAEDEAEVTENVANTDAASSEADDALADDDLSDDEDVEQVLAEAQRALAESMKDVVEEEPEQKEPEMIKVRLLGTIRK